MKKAQNPLFIRVLGNFPFLCRKHNSRTACFNANGALVANLGMTGGGVLSINGDTYIANKGWVSALLDGKANTTHTHSYLPLTGGTLTGGVNMKASTAVTINLSIGNSIHNGYVGVSAAGNFGLWDAVMNDWLIRSDSSGDTYIGKSTSDMIYSKSKFNVKYIEGYDTFSGITMTDHTTIYAQSNVNITSGASSDVDHTIVLTGANFRPSSNDNGLVTLGTSSFKWKQLYATTATISTSDRNKKKSIKKLSSLYKDFFMKLIPVSYLFKDGESGRTHIGFIAQDVEDVMNELGMSSLDFAGFCKDVKMKTRIVKTKHGDETEELYEDLDKDGNKQYEYSLRYEEFIGIIAYVLQDTVTRLDLLEENVNKMRIK